MGVSQEVEDGGLRIVVERHGNVHKQAECFD